MLLLVEQHKHTASDMLQQCSDRVYASALTACTGAMAPSSAPFVDQYINANGVIMGKLALHELRCVKAAIPVCCCSFKDIPRVII